MPTYTVGCVQSFAGKSKNVLPTLQEFVSGSRLLSLELCIFLNPFLSFILLFPSLFKTFAPFLKIVNELHPRGR